MEQERAFEKNSTVLLELLTKTQANTPLTPDDSVLAKVDYRGANSLERVASVTLNVCDEGCHQAYLTIPEHWKEGVYDVTYSFTYQGEEYKKSDTFKVEKSTQLFSLKEIKDNTSDSSNIEDENSFFLFDDYVLPPEYQDNTLLEAGEDWVEIAPLEPLQVNHTYTIVLSKDIKALSGESLDEEKAYSFTTAYQPLYATPLEVRSIIKGVIKHMDIRDIYVALRNAGRRAHQMLGENPDATNNRFQMIQERDTEYFPVTQYVAYKASRDLLNDLLIELVNGNDGIGGGSTTAQGGSFSLGDFSFKTEGGSSQSSSQSETPEEIVVINRLLKTIDEQITFWQDAMMGRNARGYARPVSAISRESAGSPESRDI